MDAIWRLLLAVVVLAGISLQKPTQMGEEEYEELLRALQNAKHAYFARGDLDPFFSNLEDPAAELAYLRQNWAQGGNDDEYSPEVEEDDEDLFRGKLEVVDDWPAEELKIGQVGGIAVCPHGWVNVFHRADRSWEKDTFTPDHTFQQKSKGPISESTVLKLNNSDGTIISKWGENMFYLPHGMTVDKDGNSWLTDVAMHQVFKFDKDHYDKPSLTLGKAFEPAKSNEDHDRFCKPTDVAVASNGDFFVADGYCASRVMKYDKEGTFLHQFGTDEFWVPHSLALAEDLDLICVADRENMRILCYNAGLQEPGNLGRFEKEYSEDVIGRVFGIAYSPKDGVLYAVSGPLTGDSLPEGFTIDLSDNDKYPEDILASWSPEDKGFDQPHDIAVSPDGEAVYVGEIGPNNVWKFVKATDDTD